MYIFQGSIITNFLSQNGQQYKIPVYQRNYEWSWEQCDKLFEDIVNASKRNQLHFCGSIVFQPVAPNKGVSFIRELLKIYELDLDEDFVYSARDNKSGNKEAEV